MSELEPQMEGGAAPASPPVLPPADRPEAGAVPPPPPKKSRAASFFFGALTGCLVVFAGFFGLALLVAAYGKDSGELSLRTDKVAIIPIEGEILDARETLELLHRYSRNATVKAMVVRINSPGGAIAPSQEIYSAIRKIRRDSDKPIVASMDSVAASGGFYIAAACDSIVANPGTITGSIGVILQWFDMKELVRWAKLKPETIISGEMKDAGSPFRELSESERQYFQRIVGQLHSQFVRAVADGRKGKISPADVAKIADGRIFTGEEAMQLKLVDQLGTIDDAVEAAAKLAGIDGKPGRIWPRRRERTLLEALTDNGESRSIIERVVSRRLPQFLYRW